MVNGIVSLISLSVFPLLVYRNSRDFCVSISYPATVLYPLISSSDFSGDIFRLFYIEDHVICKPWEFYFFFSNLNSFYFSSLIPVARTSKTMLTNSGDSGHPCLVPNFKVNPFSFLPLRIIFAVDLFVYSFYYIEVCSFYACFLDSFDCSSVLNFLKGFPCIYWDLLIC